MSHPPRTPLRIGVLFEDVQTTDLAGLDILGSLTPKIIDTMSSILPSMLPLRPLAVPMSFLYISSSLALAPTTPAMQVQPTHTYANAPRDLDILFIGGPDPTNISEESLAFVREASKRTKVVMTTCTGALWLARAGVLDGKRATTNRVMLGPAGAMMPRVEWVDRRWVVEEGLFEGAQLWTSGGAGCGIDMVIEYMLQNFDRKMVELACDGLAFEVEGRSQFYKKPLVSLA
ncbi:hypothetical protein B5807_04529 [Epicoccum nigrum]|uniref:DJ-1/PfpI domain-containing protein n=1 Tax=Epicoccum nigrum TaxID=105696 RepID=A0A1Y2M7B2_EPING|nr:hypothetical protein B5807_04529 [Epicoccum nigrum]